MPISRLRKVANDSSYLADFAAGVEPTGIFTSGNALKNEDNHISHKCAAMIVVREASPDDASNLLLLLDKIDKQDKSFLAFNMKSTLIKAQIKSGKHIVVALDGDKIVGFARESGRPNNAAMLEEIYVDPDYRGKGVATAVINYMDTKFNSIQGKIKSTNTGMIDLAKKQGFEIINTTPKGTVNMWEKKGSFSSILEEFEDVMAEASLSTEERETLASQVLEGIVKLAKRENKDVSGGGIGARVGAEYGAVTGGLAGAATGNFNANLIERMVPQLVHMSPEVRELYGITPEIFETLSEESRFIVDKGIRHKMIGAMALTGTAAGAVGGILPGAITGTTIKQNIPRNASDLKTTAFGAGAGFGTGALLPAVLARKPIPAAVGGAVGAVPGALIGHAISEGREKKAFYSDLLDGFEKTVLENYTGGNHMYRELLGEFEDTAKTASVADLEVLSTYVLAGLEKVAAQSSEDVNVLMDYAVPSAVKGGKIGAGVLGIPYAAVGAAAGNASASAAGKVSPAGKLLFVLPGALGLGTLGAALGGVSGAQIGGVVGGIKGLNYKKDLRQLELEEKNKE